MGRQPATAHTRLLLLCLLLGLAACVRPGPRPPATTETATETTPGSGPVNPPSPTGDAIDATSAEPVAAQLGTRARHVVVPAAGHGQLALPCVRELVHRFVDTEDEAAALAVDAGCVKQRPRPPLFVPPGAAETAE